MMTSTLKSSTQGAQAGATLIVSLVLLAVITILGLASIRSSNLELKMAASARDRAVAFQRAESVLNRLEEQFKSNSPPYSVKNVLSTCPGGACFNKDCNDGLCFAGDFENATSTAQCKLTKPGATKTEFWKDDAIWTNNDRHLKASVGKTKDGITVDDVRYIVEFMCFVPRSEQVVSGANQEGETDVPLFRVTVRATGEASRSTVMLQSTVRLATSI